jgi:hypothetical protein
MSSERSPLVVAFAWCGIGLALIVVAFVVVAAMFGWSKPAPPKKLADQAQPALVEAQLRLKRYILDHHALPRHNKDLGEDLWTWSAYHTVDDYEIDVLLAADEKSSGWIVAHGRDSLNVDIRLDVNTGKFSYRHRDISQDWVEE